MINKSFPLENIALHALYLFIYSWSNDKLAFI